MAKKTSIHILTVNNNPNSFSFIFPILANRRGLLERDIEIELFHSLKKELHECDVIFIENKFFTSLWRRKEEEYIYNFLERAKKAIGTVLWFDISDSTGTPQFEVLPYVDGYYKNQILRDKKLYFNNYYRTRVFSDYYHKKFGISDDAQTGREFPLNPIYINKIHVSWNPGLNDHGLCGNSYSLQGDCISHMRKYLPLRLKYTAEFVKVNKPRKADIAARLGFSHPRNFVVFHRKMLMDKLKKFNVHTKFICHNAYYKELQNVKLSISPFGLGEISYRDFETIICGALLIKPDMGHVETWPNIYKDGQTYVKCDWDFSDIEQKIEDLLSNPKKISDIAIEAQRNYRYYLYGGGRIDFCDRISEIIAKHKSS